MFLHASNRMEILLDQLATVIQTSATAQPALTPETIIVQSNGMERWIALSLAKRLGIWANGCFYFPHQAIWALFHAALPSLPKATAFAPEKLVWAIMRILPGCLNKPAFAELKHYLQDLQDERHALKRYQLAYRLAELFNQYLVFRPERMMRWEQGEEHHWQAQLWRALVELWPQQPHLARIRAQFFHAWQQQTLKIERLPARLSIFGISALPPFFLEVFMALSRDIEVHFFVLNPCREYWYDIMSNSEQVYYILKMTKLNKLSSSAMMPPSAHYHLTAGNSLLASLGKLGRDYLELLHGLAQDNGLLKEETEQFEPATAKTLLAYLQNDLLDLKERGKQADCPVVNILPTDRSLQIHACHSPMREVEVLYDQLLALFAAEPDLLPQDIIVMVPEIAAYAPYIQAVFATRLPQQPVIPFSIADQAPMVANSLITTFFSLLKLQYSRFEASRVLAILDDPQVQARFELSLADRELIQQWVTQVHICWGWDEQDRTAQNLPAFRENSWWFGLDRILLGYALGPSPEGPQLFQGILPFSDLEGHESLAVGKWLTFMRSLQALAADLKLLRPLTAWIEYAQQLLAAFFAANTPDAEIAIQTIRNALDDLLQTSQPAHYEEWVGVDVLLAGLQAILTPKEVMQGFLQEKVTFCALVPMRSIPFKVVCLLGLNDRVYPRSHKPFSFDLMSQQPRKGDRSRREDDRYLFLEAILSARCYCYLSYVGQSIQDNSRLPPSVVVAELQDYLDQGFLYDGQPAGRALVCFHPLQAFSQRYFLPPAGNWHKGVASWCFSYSQAYASVSRVLAKERHASAFFLDAPLIIHRPSAHSEASVLVPEAVTLPQWLAFFRNPVRALIKEQLKINLDPPPHTLDEREPMLLSKLDQSRMITQWLPHYIAAASTPAAIKTYYAFFRASGLLPPGQPGEWAFQQLQTRVQNLAEKLRYYQTGHLHSPQWFDIVLSGQRLTGKLEQIWPAQQVFYTISNGWSAKACIQAWIAHLLLNQLAIADKPRHTVLVSLEEPVLVFKPLTADEAETHLTQLMQWYQQGQQRPLPFFPKTSYTYAEYYQKMPDPQMALQNAQKIWWPPDGILVPGMVPERDSYAELCFGEELPEPAFSQFAWAFWEPILKAMQPAESLINASL